jgi:UDP-glucose 4,6-dehydratase
MKILLTGGAGFIGSHVATLLSTKYPDYSIIVLDKMDYCASEDSLAGCVGGDNVKLVKGDIQCADLVTHILEQYAITHVLHFAAQTHVDNSFGNSIAFTMNNTLGTHVLLEACRKYGPEKLVKFINVSTDEVYGDTTAHLDSGITEYSTLIPTNPYSAAKAGAEMLCHAYKTSYNMPIIVTRGNNVYGPGQFPEKLIPKLILLGKLGRPLTIHGDGSARRSYLEVSDVADAFDCILHRGAVGETYNIGTNDERTVLDIGRELAERFGVPIVHVRDRAFNDSRYFIASQKLQDLGWTQRVSWREGLEKTIKWYLAGNAEKRWAAGWESALVPHGGLF